MRKIKYIVIAGSSGGHILPAIKYINKLSEIKKANEILFITNTVGRDYLGQIENNDSHKLIINSKNKYNYIFKIITKMSLLFVFNRKITLIGFGGFITTPVLVISKLFNFFFLSSNKIFIHEQNIIFGLANKINYFFAKNAFISFPKVNMRRKEIFVGNFFVNTNKSKEILDNKFINILLIGGSAGSPDLNNKLFEEVMNLEKKYLEKMKFFIQIPTSHIDIFKKKYSDLINKTRCELFTFKNNLNYKDYDFIMSRSGSGSINEILFYTNSVHFIPHLASRDQHQNLNLNYFLTHNMSLKDFLIPNKKNFTSDHYFNSIINPYSIEKIICYTTR